MNWSPKMGNFIMCQAKQLWTPLIVMALLGTGGIGLGGGKEEGTFVKVEARGKLKTGIVAIGGETTGTILATKDAKLELDLSANKELQDRAQNLNGKVVLVTGMLHVRKGVETPQRVILAVATLKAAD